MIGKTAAALPRKGSGKRPCHGQLCQKMRIIFGVSTLKSELPQATFSWLYDTTPAGWMQAKYEFFENKYPCYADKKQACRSALCDRPV